MKRIATVIITLTILAAVAFSAEDTPRLIVPSGDFMHPGQGLPEKSLGWLKMDTFFGNQHIFLLTRLDQGYWMFVQIFTLKYGPTQKFGIYSKVFRDDGKTWFVKREIEMKDVNTSENGINWESKGSFVKGAWPEYRFVLNEDAFQADLTAKALVKGWNMGIFLYNPNEKAFWEVPIYIPWGRVEGKLTLDGKTIDVSGFTYGDRVYGVHRFDLVDPIFYGVRGVSPAAGSPQVSIEVAYNGINPAHGNAYCSILFIMNKDGFVLASQKMKIHGTDFTQDEETGYYFPRTFVVEADDPDRGFTLRGVFKAQRAMEIMDVISQLPPYLRALAQKFFKLPVFSKWDGIFEGSYTYKGEEVKFRIRSMGEATFIGGPERFRP